MKFYIALFTILFCITSNAQTYKQLKIYLQNKRSVEELQKIGLEFDHLEFTKDNAVIVFLNDKELSLLQNSGYNYEIIIDDWFQYFKNREQLSAIEKRNSVEKSVREFNVSGFGYGSMGGYYTLVEVIAELDTMKELYPSIITEKLSIGNTIEDRPMYMVKISDNPETDEEEPRVQYTALHHAREPESMMQMIYFMYYLLENYDSDPSVKYLVDNRELFFIPVVNPDGYEYNRQTNPDGGGFWRKNRRNNGSTYGVDLNRNYGPMAYWNAANNGSSTTPGSETYRGTAPFSEPETNNIKNFLAGKEIKNILNYHTYGNYLIYPYGALENETPDSLIFRTFASDMTAYNGYTYGTDQQTVNYSTRGNSDDYAYDGDTVLNGGKIFAMTPEVGNSSDGFWPQQSRIFPLAQENLFPNLYYAWVAGGYVSLVNANFNQQYFLPGNQVEFNPILKNKGLSTAENISVELNSLSSFAVSSPARVQIGNIQPGESLKLPSPVSFNITSNAPSNEIVKLLVTIKTNNIKMSEDTISILTGIPEYVFADTTDNLTNLWDVMSTPSYTVWEATPLSYYSSPVSYTDSKTGNYPDSATVTMTLKNQIDISSYDNPQLQFWTRFDIESGWDYGQVKISTNNGVSWLPLAGKYTKPGVEGFQPTGEPVYDGIQRNWVLEKINLTPYKSNPIKLQFELKSDEFVTRDGWYIDDIGIVVYTVVPVELISFTAKLSDNKVNIEWSTSTELNNYGFEIEKNKNPDVDYNKWYTIGFVDGKGTIEERSDYSFTDKNLSAGNTFYRLKQIDFDGTFKYSDIVSVEYSGVKEYVLSQNFPNPFNPATIINYALPKAGIISLKIYNVLGIEVAELFNEYREAGNHSFELSIDELSGKLSSGVYFYTLKAENFVQTRKMVILK